MTDVPHIRAWLGGSFDPVHHSHLQVIQHIYHSLQQQYAIFSPSLNPSNNTIHVNFLPTAGNPLKNNQSSTQHRLTMLQLAVQSIQANAHTITIDEHELHQTPPVYSINTMRAFRQKFTDDSLILVMGLDGLLDLPRWKDGLALLQYVHLWVVARDGIDGDMRHLQQRFSQAYWAVLEPRFGDLDNLIHRTHGTIYLDTHAIDARSSSQIRRLIQDGCDDTASTHLPKAVFEYIKTHGLYE